MLKFSAKTQYGLRAMVYLAISKNKVCSLREISRNEKIPFAYLEKIVSRLERARLVKSKKGIQGGYFLAKPPSKIRIGEIIRVLEGKISFVRCIVKDKRYPCPKGKEKNCLIKPFWEKIQDTLNSALNSIKLIDLIRKK